MNCQGCCFCATYLKAIRANKTLLKKNPIELLRIYNLSLLDIARIKNRNNPVQTNNTISIGGKLVAYPRITLIVGGNVAEWINTIPI